MLCLLLSQIASLWIESTWKIQPCLYLLPLVVTGSGTWFSYHKHISILYKAPHILTSSQFKLTLLNILHELKVPLYLTNLYHFLYQHLAFEFLFPLPRIPFSLIYQTNSYHSLSPILNVTYRGDPVLITYGITESVFQRALIVLCMDH